MPKEPRAYTEEEIRERFLEHVARMCQYWLNICQRETVEERMEGLAFSILSTIDGCNAALPGFKLIPNPHEDDEEYLKGQGENWYPDNVDIGGGLHEQIHSVCEKIKKE